MSFSTFRTKIAGTDYEILEQSLRELGLIVKIEADVRGLGGARVRADIVAVLKGNCDIGWSRNHDGTVDLICDVKGLNRKHNHIELINSITQKFAFNKSRAELRGKNKISSNKQLILNIDVSEDSPSDSVAFELVKLCEALNAYHIACGGTGLAIDDWKILVLSRQLVGV